MIVCDKAPCHVHKSFHVQRQNWALLENCKIVGDDVNADSEVPASICGCGAPNDAFHQFVHYARRFLEREQIGQTENRYQPRHVGDTVERNRVQLVAGDFLDSDSSECCFKEVSTGDFSEEVTSVRMEKQMINIRLHRA